MADARRPARRSFYLPSADYIWPHTLNKKVREVVTAAGGEIVGEQYFPMDHMDYEAVVADIMATDADVVFNTIVPPGLTPFLEELHRAGFTARGGTVVCTYFDENFLNLVPAEQVEGLYGCLDYYRRRRPVQHRAPQPLRRALPRECAVHRRERVHGHVPGAQVLGGGGQRGRLARTRTTSSRRSTTPGSQQGPGGPAEMVPGQHHVRMNMYIARSEGGTFEVVESLGHIDPDECEVDRP